MRIGRTSLLKLWLLALVGCRALPPPAAPRPAGVTVVIELAAPDALLVSYALPSGCASLPFAKNGDDGQAIRAAWQPQDDCGTASGETLDRHNAGCTALRFRVPATTDKVSGYPGSFPIGATIYAHTSNYAVGEACGAVTYRLLAPGGSVVMGGVVMQGAAESGAAEAAEMATLLSARPLPSSTDYFDPALGAAAIAEIKATADGTIAYLHAALPDAVFSRPFVAAAVAQEPGGPNIGGDAGDVLRLTFFNWPQTPGPDERRKMIKLVTHEFSHRFQLRDAVDVYPDARLIHEGGGEFLRWMVSLHQGWLTPTQAAQDLDDALAECMLGAGGERWRALAPRDIASRGLAYSCGLAVFVYGLTARQGEGDAMGRVNAFYDDIKKGKAPEFAQALECGETVGCQARWLPALLDRPAPMRQQWSELLGATGLATPRAPSQSQTDAMMVQAVVQLMREDCAGKSSTTPTPDSIIIDGLKSCKTLRADVEVSRVEGLPLFGTQQALPAMVAACAGRSAVAFARKDGDSFSVPCATPYAITAQFYAADLKKIVAGLDRR